MANLDDTSQSTYTTTGGENVDVVYTTKQETTPEQSKVIETIVEEQKPITNSEQFSNNLEKPKSKQGFASHPELINRGGRPAREWTWQGLLEKVAEEYKEIKLKDGTVRNEQYKFLVAKRLWHESVNGNMNAIKELMNRMDGMPMQPSDVTSGGDKLNPIQVLIVEDKKNEQE